MGNVLNLIGGAPKGLKPQITVYGMTASDTVTCKNSAGQSMTPTIRTSSISDKTFLYNKGDECSSITGGWDKSYERYGASGTFTKNSDHIYTKANGSYYGAIGGYTVNKIDVTNYSKLYFTVSSFNDPTSIGYAQLLFVTAIQPVGVTDSTFARVAEASFVYNTTSAPTTICIDISSITGSYYIGWMDAWNSCSSSMSQVWLEGGTKTFWDFKKLSLDTYTVTYGTKTKTVTVSQNKRYDVNAPVSDLILYNEGDECVDVTGGYSEFFGYPCGSITRGSDKVRCYWSGGGNIGSRTYFTTDVIDVTDYDELHIVWQCDKLYTSGTYYSVLFGTWNTSTNDWGVYTQVKNSFAKQEAVLDVSSLTGSHHFAVGDIGGDVYMYKLWLTKS